MRRRLPPVLTSPKTKERIHRFWPWVLSSVCAVMYFYNREPFDEAAGTVVTKIRRPMLKTMEWIEVHDVDPETMALELPPDMLFGPLELPKQMKFLLAALKSDNELADGYLARILIDYMDVSMDPPILSEEEFIKAGGKELLDFSVDDFTGKGSRKMRKHIFFQPDVFLQFINMIARYPTLSDYFVNQKDGVDLVLQAYRHSTDEFSRVFATRSLTLFAFTQQKDATVEKEILKHNGIKTLVDAYKQSTGDPTDTRFSTLLLSSLLRHFPKEGGKEFLEADGVEATVNVLNISRYKGVPQHLRVLHDALKLPKSATGNTSVLHRIEDADFLGVALGVVDAFPEYYEATGDILNLVNEIVPTEAKPLDLLEFRAMPILAKYYVKWCYDETFQRDGRRALVVSLFQKMLNDPTCKRCLDPSVASYELQECVKTANVAIATEKEKKILSAPS